MKNLSILFFLQWKDQIRQQQKRRSKFDKPTMLKNVARNLHMKSSSFRKIRNFFGSSTGRKPDFKNKFKSQKFSKNFF